MSLNKIKFTNISTYSDLIKAENSDLNLQSVHFLNCSIQGDKGGAIYLKNTNTEISQTSFTHVTTTIKGAAISAITF